MLFQNTKLLRALPGVNMLADMLVGPYASLHPNSQNRPEALNSILQAL